jgi:hypothetical protein
MGVVLGVPATGLGVLLTSLAAPKASDLQLCFVLAFLRIFIWYLLLFLFTKGGGIDRNRLWL